MATPSPEKVVRTGQKVIFCLVLSLPTLNLYYKVVVERWVTMGHQKTLSSVLLSPFANPIAERNCHSDIYWSPSEATG